MKCIYIKKRKKKQGGDVKLDKTTTSGNWCCCRIFKKQMQGEPGKRKAQWNTGP